MGVCLPLWGWNVGLSPFKGVECGGGEVVPPLRGVEWGFVSLYEGGMGVCLP